MAVCGSVVAAVIALEAPIILIIPHTLSSIFTSVRWVAIPNGFVSAAVSLQKNIIHTFGLHRKHREQTSQSQSQNDDSFHLL